MFCTRLVSDLPTSTFLSYLVRFLKGNTAVRFFPAKIRFSKLFFFYFFILPLESESSTLHTLFMKTWSEFLNNRSKIRLRLHQRAPKTRVLPGPLGPWTPAERTSRYVMRALRAKILFFTSKYGFYYKSTVLGGKIRVGWITEYSFWFPEVGRSVVWLYDKKNVMWTSVVYRNDVVQKRSTVRNDGWTIVLNESRLVRDGWTIVSNENRLVGDGWTIVSNESPSRARPFSPNVNVNSIRCLYNWAGPPVTHSDHVNKVRNVQFNTNCADSNLQTEQNVNGCLMKCFHVKR